MRIDLCDFQEEAVEGLVRNLENSRAQVVSSGHSQALVLSAPTGSGKTVIMAALVEAVLGGHPSGVAANTFPDDGASFVWITDQPELNTQTYNRMISYLETGRASRLAIVEEGSFDEETLSRGMLYFINTQKLGKDALLVRRSDSREYTFWDTMRNTIVRRPSSVYVIIDEAHRGMAQSRSKVKEAESIVQRFIAGHEGGNAGNMPAVPIIIGVSATPKRFNELLSKTDRNLTTYGVPPIRVRRSGLLKETIRLWRGTSQSSNEMTLLREATQRFDSFEHAWAEHCEAQAGEVRKVIRPIMLIQVEDASRSNQSADYSNTDLREVIAAVSEVLGVGIDESPRFFAHAFQEESPLDIGGVSVRRLAPADIDDDPDVRVVFFKTALNTGWDCPRAEVMMSFRAARDATSIAQLVGRMVRAPLQQHIEGFDSVLLNGVDLYLPRYDEAALEDVVDRLTDGDSEARVASRVIQSVDLQLNELIPEASECKKVLGQLATYDLRRRRAMGDVSRLMAIARRLERRSGLDPVLQDASEIAIKAITDWTLGHLDQLLLQLDTVFTEALNAAGQVEIAGKEVDTWVLISSDDGAAVRDLQQNLRAVADRDLRQRIDRADREIGEGLASVFVREQANRLREAGADLKSAIREARLQILALLHPSLDVTPGIKRQAAALVEEWRGKFLGQIVEVSDVEREELEALMRPSATIAVVSSVSLAASERIIRSKEKGDRYWDKHLYVERDGRYRAALNGWEQAVLEELISDESVVAWLRNLRGDQWRLAIPYHLNGQANLMYPDFIVFRHLNGDLVADIVDPHGLHFQDAVAKAQALADYAEAQKGTPLASVVAAAVVDGEMCRRDLSDNGARDHVRQCKSGTDLQLWLMSDIRAPGAGFTYEASALRTDTGDSAGAVDYADYI